LRIVIFLGIGYIGLTFFKEIGAPIIALAEIALLLEAIILFGWLSQRTHEPIHVGGSVIKGMVAAVVGGAAAYGLATYLPGGAISTALIGMTAGGIIALIIVWSDAKLLLKL
jgi:hypothetical protein